MATAKWFTGGFILVTVADSQDRFQHPRISVCKLYEGTPAEDRATSDERLPAKNDHPTRNAETLLAFEFQQNASHDYDIKNHSACEPWLKLGDVPTSGAYGGHVETAIRVESWGVDTRDIMKRLGDVDRALKTWRERVKEAGARLTECDATALMLALKTVFKLPVMFVVYRGHARAAYVEHHPDFTLDTSLSLKNFDANLERTNRQESH